MERFSGNWGGGKTGVLAIGVRLDAAAFVLDRYSTRGRSFARISSMMKSGSVSMNRALRPVDRERAAGCTEPRLGSRFRRRSKGRRTRHGGRSCALRDGTRERSSGHIEGFRRDDHHISRASLFAALGRIQIDVKDVATLHRLQASRPTAGASIHARSSADRGALASHCATSSVKL